mmetsp:Transcript_21551/g.54345  ORF Transcript_21551/g.54345 Transcript_21551/m.54345 type:complete len:221 (-) Transcript_21551:1840-2502(-)
MASTKKPTKRWCGGFGRSTSASGPRPPPEAAAKLRVEGEVALPTMKHGNGISSVSGRRAGARTLGVAAPRRRPAASRPRCPTNWDPIPPTERLRPGARKRLRVMRRQCARWLVGKEVKMWTERRLQRGETNLCRRSAAPSADRSRLRERPARTVKARRERAVTASPGPRGWESIQVLLLEGGRTCRMFGRYGNRPCRVPRVTRKAVLRNPEGERETRAAQ